MSPGITGARALGVGQIAGCNIKRNAGVDAAIETFKQIQIPDFAG